MSNERIFAYALYAGAGLVAGGMIGLGATLAIVRIIRDLLAWVS